MAGERLHVVGAHVSNGSLSSAVTLTPPARAGRLVIQALTQNVRVRLDGTAPTTTVGFQVKAGDPPVEIGIGRNTVVKVIEETPSATINYQWAE